MALGRFQTVAQGQSSFNGFSHSFREVFLKKEGILAAGTQAVDRCLSFINNWPHPHPLYGGLPCSQPRVTVITLRGIKMSSPYGFDLVEDCLTCPIRSDSFFCGLPTTALQAFNKIKYTASYPQNSVLFVEGQMPRGIYMLCKGRVKMSATSADGKTLILKIARPGEVLGLHATVSGSPYEITAETGQPCQLNFVKREDFLRFLGQHSDACLQAAQHLSKDCQSAYQQIRSLGLSQSAPERLARLLLEWSIGSNDKDNVKMKLSLTHDEISQIIGTSRETVTRVLADFRKKHFAVLKGSTLTIENKPALERMVS
jgi:CRP/FNR family transcriptional regulator, cyclic AMP receptor protein